MTRTGSGPDGPTWQWRVAQRAHREEYAAARAMAADGRLVGMYTDVWCPSGTARILRRGPSALRRLALRSHPDLADQTVISWTASGAVRSLSHGRRNAESRFSDYLRKGRWFDAKVAQHLRGENLDPSTDAFFGFRASSYETLKHLRARGVVGLLDQYDPGRVHHGLVREEEARWPGWSSVPHAVPDAYYERMEAEWDVATGLIVNSEWSARALVEQGVARDRLAVVPLAYEPHAPVLRRPARPDQPLTILWLGAVSLGKGIQYLLEAAHLLADRSLRFVIVGPLRISDRALRSAPDAVDFRGQVTHDKVSELFAEADVFVFPTISDGFGRAQLEALAHGLPVVATSNCGEVVDDGSNGRVIPARDSEALASALAALDDNRDLLAGMSERAPLTAAAFSLDAYRRGLDNAAIRFRQEVA